MALGETFPTTLAAARTGAEWAWTLLYRELATSLVRYLKARGAVDSENLLGDVFVQVVKTLPRFQGGESEFRARVYTIARNQLVDQRRYWQRRLLESPFEEVPVPGDGDQTATSEGAQTVLREVLDHLTPDQRDVLFLRVLAGLSLEETAQVLGKPTTAVKRLQARGLESLRQKVAAGTVSL